MLIIEIPERELFNEETQEFIKVKATSIQLEHSLISISKWESKWHKPFISEEQKTSEEFLDYIRCMTITQNVDKNVYNALTSRNLNDISSYIDNPMTATTVSSFQNDKNRASRKERVTSELIYYWMVAYNINFECEKWHLNRLLMLIRICKIKNSDPKKLSRSQILERNKAINEANKAKYKTRG